MTSFKAACVWRKKTFDSQIIFTLRIVYNISCNLVDFMV